MLENSTKSGGRVAANGFRAAYRDHQCKKPASIFGLLLPVGLGTAAETNKTAKTRLFPPPTRPTITLKIKVSGG
jgi:hypothetical protein